MPRESTGSMRAFPREGTDELLAKPVSIVSSRGGCQGCHQPVTLPGARCSRCGLLYHGLCFNTAGCVSPHCRRSGDLENATRLAGRDSPAVPTTDSYAWLGLILAVAAVVLLASLLLLIIV